MREDARAAQATQTTAVGQAVSVARRLVVAPAEMRGKRAFLAATQPMRSGTERAGSVVTDASILLSSRREGSVTCSIVDGSRLVFVFGA